ncbi:putative short chain oxidoreductase [Streptomyces ambofaciens ATCC 23877]|uniref:Putative short chain oxidoreductase n=1 Tax=Streptomyces ambofaciens (strain ATCC 23877 / 3486 / DSM 40053 / JCM 4204 / NBRC 12836 / NRRL B-2516) TaxID=278992 RepID=A0AC09_STRA7|nr:SDR family oxidoreductase [Streptomyces ambofaciens]AKZ60349.1 putative short chain oxidoreductase [Streptomyces ambofaciens ATCC 23877]CAJ88013.1 putative short chain oxidoreductase [Streptomyces ambofaciens ATCC 23877]
MPAPSDKAARHWFVTGASGGLGRRLTEHALRNGDRVTATVRRPAALEDLREAYGDRLTVETLDLTRPADVDKVVARTLRSGPVDVVVNNAGYAVVGAAEEMTAEQMRDQIEVLLLAPMMITRAFLQSMREQGGGRIIQISSMGGQIGTPTHSSYHAGKWGLEGFTESVSREVSDFNIHLTLVEPGATRTGFASALQYTTETTVYRDSAVGRTRRYLETADENVFTGDPAKLAAAIYDTTRHPSPPLRLTLGADTYGAIHAALTERLTALEAQKELAESVAFTR